MSFFGKSLSNWDRAFEDMLEHLSICAGRFTRDLHRNFYFGILLADSVIR